MITNYTNTNSIPQSSTSIFDLPSEAVCETGYEDGTWDYDVIVHTHEDLHSLYHDLEEEAVTPPGLDIMRPVECINRWPSSRATTFRLTPEEAQRLTQDPRVLEIELNERHLGHQTVTQVRRQFSDSWSKDSNYITDVKEKNWGLYRCLVTDEPYNDWIFNGDRTRTTATIELTMTGKNVDIVILDNNEMDWQHPEFATGEDGLGASRLNYYNWRRHWPAVFGLSEGTYPQPYQYALSQNPAYTLAQRITLWQQTSNHPTHVAGIAAGNTQGWASDANIYHIFYNASRKFALIREFHNNKPINPLTGRRNPTIINNSWIRGVIGSSYPNLFDPGLVEVVTYRGVTYTGTFTEQMLIDFGIYDPSAGTSNIGVRNAGDDADIQDCINDGIIVVAGAGNDGHKIDVPGGIDYDNSFTTAGYISGTPIYWNRGPGPGATPNVICVGAIGAQFVPMAASGYTNNGPRVDIFAPGDNIVSSVNNLWGGASTDTRKITAINTITGPYFENFYVGKMSGTSMACPQVTGVLACLLEVYPNMTQSEALTYITTSHVSLNQISDFYNPREGAPNRFLFYNAGEKAVVGPVIPKVNYKTRPRSGPTFPRTRQGPRSKPQ